MALNLTCSCRCCSFFLRHNALAFPGYSAFQCGCQRASRRSSALTGSSSTKVCPRDEPFAKLRQRLHKPPFHRKASTTVSPPSRGECPRPPAEKKHPAAMLPVVLCACLDKYSAGRQGACSVEPTLSSKTYQSRQQFLSPLHLRPPHPFSALVFSSSLVMICVSSLVMISTSACHSLSLPVRCPRPLALFVFVFRWQNLRELVDRGTGARERLVLSHVRLVMFLAGKRGGRTALSSMDLIQVCVIYVVCDCRLESLVFELATSHHKPTLN